MNNPELKQQVGNRRTLTIISRPDTGKTTIAEQLLLFSGTIRQAGTIKEKKTDNFAKSDWMEIERQRGTSITSSVMQFDYQGKRVNILDTPRHEDFSEDTYRTLMAVDSAAMVIDNAKGIKAQTKKLLRAVKERGTPIFTFINELDRDGREPLELLEKLEELLDVESYPISQPVDMREGLEGLYDIYHNRVEFYRPENYRGERLVELDEDGLFPGNYPLAENSSHEQVLEGVELLKEAGDTFNQEKVARGGRTSVFFGSALTNFGAQTFLEAFVGLTPAPYGHKAQDGQMVSPYEGEFSDSVFKIQANMSPTHRGRIASIRICPGTFERGMDV